MIVYMAHPVRPVDGETVERNLQNARAWLRWCHEKFPAWTTIAPWIPECEVYDDSDETQRAAIMTRQLDVVRRCDAVLLAGHRISSGMKAEARAAMKAGRRVFDMTNLDPGDLVFIESVELVEIDGDWPDELK